jgi:hypothetical protein
LAEDGKQAEPEVFSRHQNRINKDVVKGARITFVVNGADNTHDTISRITRWIDDGIHYGRVKVWPFPWWLHLESGDFFMLVTPRKVATGQQQNRQDASCP